MPIRSSILVLAVLLATAAGAFAQGPPLALSAEVTSLGRGASGTVVAIVVRIAPEDRERAGERLRIVTTLRTGENVVDRQAAVVTVEPDGSAMLFREWAPATYELQVTVASVDGPSDGVWFGEIEVLAASEPYLAPEGAPVDAIALALSPPRDDAVSFRPPPNLGGLGAVQLEVDAPAATAAVEFFNAAVRGDIAKEHRDFTQTTAPSDATPPREPRKATAHLSIIVAFRQVLKRTGGIAKPASLGAPIAALERFIAPLAGHLQAFFLPAPDFVFVNFKSPDSHTFLPDGAGNIFCECINIAPCEEVESDSIPFR